MADAQIQESSASSRSLPRPALLIRGGEVFNPASGTLSPNDVLVSGGRIVRLSPEVPGQPGLRGIDAKGLVVTPGLIDAHVHAFRWGHLISVDVDPLSSRSGVTTFVDGGSSGALNFMAFRKFVIEQVKSNLFALLHVSAIGQLTDGIAGADVGECDDLRFLHLDSAVEIVEANRDVIVGIKVRMYTGLTSVAPIATARELADAVGLPMVVHLAKAPPSFTDILPYLRPGDYVTHIYHPGPGALLDRRGRVRAEYMDARQQGVLFDTGTARFHTSFPIARAAMDQGFIPDTISTDLTLTNYDHITIDLPTTLTKFMALGLSLPQVLTLATTAPAKMLPPGRGYGQIAVGLPADSGVFAVEEGSFTYDDFFGHNLTATRRLVPRITIKEGEILTPEPQEPMPLRFMRR